MIKVRFGSITLQKEQNENGGARQLSHSCRFQLSPKLKDSHRGRLLDHYTRPSSMPAPFSCIAARSICKLGVRLLHQTPGA